MYWQQKEGTRREIDDLCGSCTSFSFLISSFIRPSLHLFHGMLTLFTYGKHLNELAECRRTHDTFLRVGLSIWHMGEVMFGEKKWPIGIACEESTVSYTATCLCFLCYCFWNLFAIAETRLKFKKEGINTTPRIHKCIAGRTALERTPSRYCQRYVIYICVYQTSICIQGVPLCVYCMCQVVVTSSWSSIINDQFYTWLNYVSRRWISCCHCLWCNLVYVKGFGDTWINIGNKYKYVTCSGQGNYAA